VFYGGDGDDRVGRNLGLFGGGAGNDRIDEENRGSFFGGPGEDSVSFDFGYFDQDGDPL
jgi:hypothetical protein